ncbi:small acid-soluble spore protein Tlp [Heliophilum fasciatum]|uniref:Protein Tlp homolog n=1 Tax=Heliophilum fasciatum TaxID=35700 RepID=A0A4R2RLP7_9FIRM|nr:small acid-soluble spore protein Tlp [Heliophilum fasciatum]MCW2278260.1 small acid-soluble spore protein (thioredoxin-like protein) [Heliophilum fasciatum]TCP63884.1 small acid-soluble spore protein (thioredoxin-like protein) [Heliophilum fasciatum]
MAKPDNRADNVENIQSIIDHTMEAFHNAEDQIKAHGDQMSAQDLNNLKAKNERRKDALDGLRAEIKDEARYQAEAHDMTSSDIANQIADDGANQHASQQDRP